MPREYLRHHSEDAFAALVYRHVDLVFSVAVRLRMSEDAAHKRVQRALVEQIVKECEKR